MKRLLLLTLAALCVAAPSAPAADSSAPAAPAATDNDPFAGIFPPSYPENAPAWSRFHLERESTSVSLSGPYGTLWRGHFDPAAQMPWFDVSTSDGRLLTWQAPDDHPWHHGLWHSWKYINGVNYWETDAATGRAEGRTELISWQADDRGEAGVNLACKLVYRGPWSAPRDEMEERVDIRIMRPTAEGAYWIDFRFEARALVPVVLGRTPLAGEPDGKSWGGYAGLSWRGGRFLKDVAYTNDRGETGADVHGRPARFVTASGLADGRAFALTFFEHRENPGYPTSWYTVAAPQKTGPFWYLSPAVIYHKPLKLAAGDVLVRRYRVRIDAHAVAAATLVSDWESFQLNAPSTP
jgi:hypothetical protein